MPSLKEYFDNDFKDLSLDSPITMTLTKLDNEKNVIGTDVIEIKQRIRHNLDSSARLFTYYVPATTDTLGIIGEILNQLDNQIKNANNAETIGGFMEDVQVGIHKSLYSCRIYFYTETLLTKEEINRLDDFCKSKNLFVTVRSSDYFTEKNGYRNTRSFHLA